MRAAGNHVVILVSKYVEPGTSTAIRGTSKDIREPRGSRLGDEYVAGLYCIEN